MPSPAKLCEDLFALQHENILGLGRKISLANFSIPISLLSEGGVRPITWENKMAWNTPRIVEVPVGMEINMYACAARK